MPIKFSDSKKDNEEYNLPMHNVFNGFAGNIDPNEKPSNSLFKRSTHLKADGNTYKLPGAIGKFLGILSDTDNSITLTGEMGSGKTRFALQLANAYASLGKRVAIFSLEMSPDNYKVIEMKNQYIVSKNQQLVDWAGEVPNGITDVENATADYDVILIDSFGKLTPDPKEFDRLIKTYRNTAWVVLFQKNGKGTIRGGPSVNFDAWINLDTIKGAHYKENYVIATKNRYGEVGIKYNVYSGGIMNNENK
ncbi:MAG: AAA family ATPase [bacterium]|nr:AAA family ATPase [bacterium]